MTVKKEVDNKQRTPRERIQSRVLKEERMNYALKPEGKRDSEMVEVVKRIIEQEVGK